MIPVKPTCFTGIGPITWDDYGPTVHIKDARVTAILKKIYRDRQPPTAAHPGALYKDLQRASLHPATTPPEKRTLAPLIQVSTDLLHLELCNLRREHGSGICDFKSDEARQRYWSAAMYQHYGKVCFIHVVDGEIQPHENFIRDIRSHTAVYFTGLCPADTGTGLRLSFNVKHGGTKHDYSLHVLYEKFPCLDRHGMLFPMDCLGRRTVVTSPLYYFPMPDTAAQDPWHDGTYSHVRWRIIRDDGIETRSGNFQAELLLPQDRILLQKFKMGRVAVLQLHPSIVGDDIHVVKEGSATTRLKHEYFWVAYLVNNPSPWLEKAFAVGAPLFIRLLTCSPAKSTEILKEADKLLGEGFYLGSPGATGYQLKGGNRQVSHPGRARLGEPYAVARRFFCKARRPEMRVTYDFATTSVLPGIPHYILTDRARAGTA